MNTSKNDFKPAWALWDSAAGTYTTEDVKRAAWALYAAGVREMLCSTYSDIKIPRFDQRYNFNREAEAAAREIVRAKGVQGIRRDRERHRERTRAKVEERRRPINILASPIVRDYRENHGDLLRVNGDRLIFSGRNHWAKDERDKRILAILARYANK